MRTELICGAFFSPPLVYWSESAGCSGPFPRIVVQLAAHAGFTTKFQHIGHYQLAHFDETNFDLALAIFDSPRRSYMGMVEGAVAEVAVQAAGPLGQNHRADDKSLTTILDSNRRIVVKEGDIGHDVVLAQGAEWLQRVTVEPATSNRDLAELLSDPGIDFVISDALTLTSIMTSPHSSGMARRLVFSKPTCWLTLGVLVSHDSPYSPEAFRADWANNSLLRERQHLYDVLETYGTAVLRPPPGLP
ncbi:hypothetical protein AB0F88_41985 [Streptosporangium sp. NPDC023963]|uniref:hypothetical protein n=1 Tax=Streptosporangium sp. NPDC023963 TaxID=3155608 RepID=UPI003415909A